MVFVNKLDCPKWTSIAIVCFAPHDHTSSHVVITTHDNKSTPPYKLDYQGSSISFTIFTCLYCLYCALHVVCCALDWYDCCMPTLPGPDVQENSPKAASSNNMLKQVQMPLRDTFLHSSQQVMGRGVTKSTAPSTSDSVTVCFSAFCQMMVSTHPLKVLEGRQLDNPDEKPSCDLDAVFAGSSRYLNCLAVPYTVASQLPHVNIKNEYELSEVTGDSSLKFYTNVQLSTRESCVQRRNIHPRFVASVTVEGTTLYFINYLRLLAELKPKGRVLLSMCNGVQVIAPQEYKGLERDKNGFVI